MNKPNTTSSTIFGIVIAISVIVSAFILADAVKFVKRANETITIKGYAEKDIISDMASWTGSFSRRSADLVSGYNALERDREIVLNYLVENGFTREQIKLEPVQTYPVYEINSQGMNTNNIISHEMSQNFTVESDDVRLVERISSEATELIKQDIGLRSYTPQYTYSKLNDLKIEMLALATKDAKNRAEVLAENSGSKIGSLKSAQQGVFQITGANSTDISDYGMYNTNSIEKTIKSVVTIEYNIR